MIKSAIPTNYILVKAYTNSESDACDFAIIYLNPEWCLTLVKRYKTIELLLVENYFCGAEYWEAPEGYYLDFNTNLDMLLQGCEWVYVDINDSELEALGVPEQRLDCHTLYIDRYGAFMFRAYGKHTGEEFWTGSISIKNIAVDWSIKL